MNLVEQQVDFAEIITLTPLQAIYEEGDILTLNIALPSTNNFFANYLNTRNKQVDLFEESGDNFALINLLDDDLFTGNTLSYIKGSEDGFPNLIRMPYNPQTGMYEMEVQIRLDRFGAYSHEKSGIIFLGLPDPINCVDYRLNVEFTNVEGQFVEFTVNEFSAAG